MGETNLPRVARTSRTGLSVSSNGSTWVKRLKSDSITVKLTPFSILERIDVGETAMRLRPILRGCAFSILERIDVGETPHAGREPDCGRHPFSILERIDVGETRVISLMV